MEHLSQPPQTLQNMYTTHTLYTTHTVHHMYKPYKHITHSPTPHMLIHTHRAIQTQNTYII